MCCWNIKASTILICMAIVSACVSTNNADYYYNEIQLRNNTASTVTDVVISVKNTGGVFSCSYIPPSSVCSSTFQKRKFLGYPVTVKWTINGITKSTDHFFVTVPHAANRAVPLRGVLEMIDNGKIRPYLEQDAGQAQ